MMIQEGLPMERRQQPRSDINRTSSLSYPPLGLLQVRISNISDTGVFIHSGTIRLGLYNNAEIIECVNNTLTPIQAEVVRVSTHGAGLRFIDPNPALIQRLHANHAAFSAVNDGSRK